MSEKSVSVLCELQGDTRLMGPGWGTLGTRDTRARGHQWKPRETGGRTMGHQGATRGHKGAPES